MPIVIACVILALITIAFFVWLQMHRQAKAREREHFIRHFKFPKGIYAKVIERHPQLSLRDMELVGQGLRQFFLAYLKSGEQYVSMPSQVADDLWHEFILYTKNYAEFNRRAFKKFLHHTPAAAVSDNNKANTGLRRCWEILCKEENINPRKANRLPLLFALDAKFSIVNGFRYTPDCNAAKAKDAEDGGGAIVIYCGTDLASSGDSSGDWESGAVGGALSGDGGSSSDGGDSGGGDSSCGGGGCGGGCGGGD